MNSTPEQILDIEDALVCDENPPRYINGGTLDYERCARLHNYLVAYGWMARHKRDTLNLDALAREKWFWSQSEENIQDIRERLIPSLNSFLDLIYDPEPGFFYWVERLEMRLCDEDFPHEDNELEGKERFVLIYGTSLEIGPHSFGVVYDQQLHRALFPMTVMNWESIDPEDGHDELWYPLETILSHWIDMIRLGKIVPGLPEESSYRMQIGLWSWMPYCDAQIESTVAAMEHYSATVESRMPPGSHLSLSPSTTLFTDTDLDAAAVPEDCFIRSFLKQVKTPRFKFIAPALEVPHDKEAFAARQQFTRMWPYEQGSIPSVLLFAASATVDLNTEIRWLFKATYEDRQISMSDGDPVVTGLYSEPTHRSHYDTEETGFRLLLPFPLNRARLSDGSLVRPDSYTQLFQHGHFHWFGGEWRSQRLERLFTRWTELIESGVWTVGKDGVEGLIDKFGDADNDNTWGDYWIPPDW